MENLFSMKNINKRFGKVQVLKDVQLISEQRGDPCADGGKWCGQIHIDEYFKRCA
jgi:ABC-type histidine transport system ATPase subunit